MKHRLKPSGVDVRESVQLEVRPVVLVSIAKAQKFNFRFRLGADGDRWKWDLSNVQNLLSHTDVRIELPFDEGIEEEISAEDQRADDCDCPEKSGR